jgi:hypothetical protein
MNKIYAENKIPAQIRNSKINYTPNVNTMSGI